MGGLKVRFWPTSGVTPLMNQGRPETRANARFLGSAILYRVGCVIDSFNDRAAGGVQVRGRFLGRPILSSYFIARDTFRGGRMATTVPL